VLLENPVFFDKADWIDVPSDWGSSIVQDKGYDTTLGKGALLWKHIEMLLSAGHGRTSSGIPSSVIPNVFGKEYLRKSRPGQAGFRLGLLDAAHIQPVERQGSNELTNGLVLRSDMHKLYDDGMIAVAPDRTIMICKQIRELYVNGKVYYSWDGKPLTITPKDEHLLPSTERLEWHMKNVWIG